MRGGKIRSCQVHVPELGETAPGKVADRVQIDVGGPSACVDRVVVDAPGCRVGDRGPVAVAPFKELKTRVSGEFVGQVDGRVDDAGRDEGASAGDARGGALTHCTRT